MHQVPVRGAIAALVMSTICWVAPVKADGITLEQALQLAAQRQIEIGVAATDLTAAQGEADAASPWLPNPEVEAAAGPKWLADGVVPAVDLSLSQPLPWIGKRGDRVAAARARIEAARSRLDQVRAEVAAAVRRSFWLALVERERQGAAIEAEQIGQELLTIADKRLALGSSTQLDFNVARAAVGRAHAERIASERHFRAACADLASSIGGASDEKLEPAGQLPPLGPAPADETKLLALLAQRPDLRAWRHAVDAANSDQQAADLAVIPDPTLVGSFGHEGDENTLLIGLALPLPVWNQAQGERAIARAARERAKLELEHATQAAARDLRAALTSYRSAVDAVQSFDRDVVAQLHENLALARSAFQAGKIGLTEFNLMRRDLLETRSAYLDAQSELIEARHRLERALGRSLEEVP